MAATRLRKYKKKTLKKKLAEMHTELDQLESKMNDTTHTNDELRLKCDQVQKLCVSTEKALNSIVAFNEYTFKAVMNSNEWIRTCFGVLDQIQDDIIENKKQTKTLKKEHDAFIEGFLKLKGILLTGAREQLELQQELDQLKLEAEQAKKERNELRHELESIKKIMIMNIFKFDENQINNHQIL